MTGPAARERAEAAAAAIRYHYDVGNDFYALWLDRSLTYSCAMPRGADDTLECAQQRKLRYHLDAVRAGGAFGDGAFGDGAFSDGALAHGVLDIGCGWGSLLAELSQARQVRRSVGLTLSDEQAAFVWSRGYPGVEVRTGSWTDCEPGGPFDGIVSIGAFEHFARPDDGSARKVRVYREFFERCRGWLAAGGVLSLQTIAYANMSAGDASQFMVREVFPDADLPTLAEITAAAERVFEIQAVRNDRLDYAWTCEQWARRLRASRPAALRVVGPETVARYERYLKMSALGFRMGKICLLRLILRPYGRGYFGGARDDR
jgi:cyclopropane-fatty-acyl-phospholipid synthase